MPALIAGLIFATLVISAVIMATGNSPLAVVAWIVDATAFVMLCTYARTTYHTGWVTAAIWVAAVVNFIAMCVQASES